MLRSYHVDKAIISAKGIDMNAGLTDSDDLHANNKRTMLTRAKEKILAEALANEKEGVDRFAIVTAGRSLSGEDSS